MPTDLTFAVVPKSGFMRITPGSRITIHDIIYEFDDKSAKFVNDIFEGLEICPITFNTAAFLTVELKVFGKKTIRSISMILIFAQRDVKFARLQKHSHKGGFMVIGGEGILLSKLKHTDAVPYVTKSNTPILALLEVNNLLAIRKMH